MADARFVKRLRAFLPAALLVFVAAGFALPTEPAYALVFYAVVIPCCVARIWQVEDWVGRDVPPGPPVDHSGEAPLSTGSRHAKACCARRGTSRPTQSSTCFSLIDTATALAVALIIWSALTLLWGTDDGHRRWRFAADSASTLIFLLAMRACWADAQARARLGDLLVAAGAANAVFSIAVFIITHPVYPRLRGWGATHHEILGAAVMTVPALTALARSLAPVADARARALHLAGFGVMAAFVLMTESRGPLLAGLAAVLFLCVASVWRVRAVLAMAALAAAWFSLPEAAQRHGEAVLVQRGSSHRFQVWAYTFGLIRDRPLFGHGLAANLRLMVGGPTGDLITFPHDLYLSLLFYSGVVGFVLFLALAAVVSWRLLPWVWRQRSGTSAWLDTQWAWLVALWIDVLVVGLTDLGQITKGPGPLWFILWIPVGLILGASRPGLAAWRGREQTGNPTLTHAA